MNKFSNYELLKLFTGFIIVMTNESKRVLEGYNPPPNKIFLKLKKCINNSKTIYSVIIIYIKNCAFYYLLAC